MDKAFGFFGLGLWFGITGPLVFHWMILFTDKVSRLNGTKVSAKMLEQLSRLVIGPLLMLSCLGIASVLGQTHGSSDYAAPGMFLGFAVSGIYLWLNHKIGKSSAGTSS